jgi:hypothetical protein
MHSKQHRVAGRVWQTLALAAAVCLAGSAAAAPVQQPTASQLSAQKETHITPDQAKQLFALVDELIKFSSQETGLPIKSTVKRQLTTRATVESYLKEKFDEDQGAKRLQKGEIVLKKFGLLDRDFALKPFLLALLNEQIEAYYDSKTKTVNMLDWVSIDEQKPVLAHELTHALQDQHSDLEKWNDQTPDEVSTNSSGDTDHLAKDELDTARDAVAEGQATAVMMDYILKPMGKSLIKNPEVMEFAKQQMSASDSSPVLSRAPLLLSESLLFPYREGLSFEQDVWMDQGQAAAFAGALDHPPTSSWEIINPREYEHRHTPAVPLMPDIHPLVDKVYKPYDIGQVGQLDLHILAVATTQPATSPPPGMAASTGLASASPPRLPRSRPAPNPWLSSTSPSGRTPPPPRPLPVSTPTASAASIPASCPTSTPNVPMPQTCRPANLNWSTPPAKAPSSSPRVAS